METVVLDAGAMTRPKVRPGGRAVVILSPREEEALLRLKLAIGERTGRIPGDGALFRRSLGLLVAEVLGADALAELPPGKEDDDARGF
jgi:hypothetical protein